MNAVSAYIGLAIRQMREEVGISQAQLARDVGCSGKHMNSIEMSHAVGSLDMLEEIASTLGCSLSELIARAERLSKPSD